MPRVWLLLLLLTHSVGHCASALSVTWTPPGQRGLRRDSFSRPACIVTARGTGVLLSVSPSHLRTLPAQCTATRYSKDKDLTLLTGLRKPGRYRLKVAERPNLMILVPSASPPPGASHVAKGAYPKPTAKSSRTVREHLASYRYPGTWVSLDKSDSDWILTEGVSLTSLFVHNHSQSGSECWVPFRYALVDTIATIRKALVTQGLPAASLHLLSAFRNPAYNRKVGSSSFSRHLYGDAFDFVIDRNGDGKMDDLTGDSRVDRSDALWCVALIETLQARKLIPMGGIGVYTFARGKHRVSLHVDIRGHRATWAFDHDSRGAKERVFLAEPPFCRIGSPASGEVRT